MTDIPIYPKHKIWVMDDDSESYRTNTVRVKIETRVPHELIEQGAGEILNEIRDLLYPMKVIDTTKEIEQ